MIRAAGIRQLLIDLQGPELRIGTLAEPVTLVEGSSVRLGADGIPCPAALVQAAAPGQQLLLDDGKLLVQVTQTLPGALFVHSGTRRNAAEPQEHCCAGPCSALSYPDRRGPAEPENRKAVRCYRRDAALLCAARQTFWPCAVP